MFLNGNEGLQWVKSKLAENGPATLVVAFWGAGAIEALGLDKRSVDAPKVRIVCNLKMGGTNPYVVEKLQQLSTVTVEQSDRLHGKVYLFHDDVMVGSSNASANGLSFEGTDAQAWAEANLVSSEETSYAAAFTWVNCLAVSPILEPDLKLAKGAWERRRAAIIADGDPVPITELLKRDPSTFSGRNFYLALSYGNYSENAKNILDEKRKNFPNIDAWEDWEELPKTGVFISFYNDSLSNNDNLSNSLEYDGSYVRDAIIPDLDKTASHDSMQWCFPATAKFLAQMGVKDPKSDKKGWKKVVDAVINGEDHPNKTEAICIEFEKLAQIWQESLVNQAVE